MTPWLDPIPEVFRDEARALLEAGDETFLSLASNEHGIELVYRNLELLRARNCYEAALVQAFTSTRVNHHRVPLGFLRLLFEIADRDTLRAAGDPLPGHGPFTLYRGVAGHGRARRIRGLSWTADRDRARWFANRFPTRFTDPAVFTVTVEESAVLFYYNDRQEQEYVVLLPESVKPVRI